MARLGGRALVAQSHLRLRLHRVTECAGLASGREPGDVAKAERGRQQGASHTAHVTGVLSC